MTEPSMDRVVPGERDASLGSGAMFDTIADRYDLLNRMMSFGIDTAWRRATAEAIAPAPGTTILDVATGTADLAIVLARRFEACKVVGVDPSAAMLEVGREKIARQGLADRVSLTMGIAEQLPFDDQAFGGVSIAFGIRNVVGRPVALREMHRVLAPGARLAILELTEPDGGAMAALAKFHVHRVVPALGAMISGRRAYAYLSRSIAGFPRADVFAETIREAGFVIDEVRPLTFGVAHLFVAHTVGA